MDKPARKKYDEIVWTPELVQRFWDFESQFPEQYYSFKFGKQIIDRSLALLGLSEPDCSKLVWLDYGCGYGSLTERLLERGIRVVIHDLSAQSLAACKDRSSRYPEFMGTLAENEAPIDVVSLIEVVEHVEFQTMKEIVALLRETCTPGAKLILTTPNAEDIHAPRALAYCPNCDTVRHRWQHLRSFTKESLAQEMVALGFRYVQVSEENFRKESRFDTKNPFRKLKRIVCDHRAYRTKDRPNLLAVGEL